MKKLLLASLIAVSSVAAQAQTQLYGTISQYADKTSGQSATVANNLSRIGVTSQERIGDLTARIQIETNIAANDPVTGAATRLGDRQSTIGLAAKGGSIDFGRNVHGQFLAVTIHDPFATAYGSVAGDHHNLRGLRMSNATFVSFSPVKNLTVNYDREIAQDGAQSIAAFANFGKLSAAAAHYRHGDNNTSVVSGTADAKFVRVSGIWSRSEDGSHATTAKTVGAAFPVNAKITAKTSYGETSQGAQAFNVGADYALSKRTIVSAVFKNDMKTDVHSLGFGITHSF